MNRRGFFGLIAAAGLVTAARVSGLAQAVVSPFARPVVFDLEVIPASESPFASGLYGPQGWGVPCGLSKAAKSTLIFTTDAPCIGQSKGSWSWTTNVDGEVKEWDTRKIMPYFEQAERLHSLSLES